MLLLPWLHQLYFLEEIIVDFVKRKIQAQMLGSLMVSEI